MHNEKALSLLMKRYVLDRD